MPSVSRPPRPKLKFMRVSQPAVPLAEGPGNARSQLRAERTVPHSHPTANSGEKGSIPSRNMHSGPVHLPFTFISKAAYLLDQLTHKWYTESTSSSLYTHLMKAHNTSFWRFLSSCVALKDGVVWCKLELCQPAFRAQKQLGYPERDEWHRRNTPPSYTFLHHTEQKEMESCVQNGDSPAVHLNLWL